MSEMVAFRQGTSMPSRETILRYVVETVNQITELEPALHLLPWSGVNSAIYEQRFAQCYDEGLCAAQTSAPNVPQGILPSTDWAQGIGLLCFAAGYMSAGERPLTHNQLCDFVKQAAVGLSPIEGRRRAVSRRYVVLHYPYSGDYNAMVTRLGSCCYKRCCIWLPGKRIAVCASTGATTALMGGILGEGGA